MRMIKKAQFGWIGKLTGSKYVMGPRINPDDSADKGKKGTRKAGVTRKVAKKKVKKKVK